MRGTEVLSIFQMLRDGYNALREFIPKKEKDDSPPPLPPDFSKETGRLRADLSALSRADSPVARPVLEKPTQTSPERVLTRPGVDSVRLGWQDDLIRAELWLLEGHLKNNCLGCGGDVECCFKHSTNLGDATGETKSMTTDPLYRKTVELARRILPLVHPDDVKAGIYRDRYPALVIEVSEIRTEFDNRRMARKPSPATLEQAKKEVAALAMEEVERRWAGGGGNPVEAERTVAEIKGAIQAGRQVSAEELKRYKDFVDAEQRHKWDIRLEAEMRAEAEKAKAQGKPVPAEVRARFPDLFPHVVSPGESSAKEPWQMTRDEFNGFVEALAQKEGRYQGGAQAFAEHGISADDYQRVFDIKYSGFENFHRAQIRKALSEGKPVPPEVLKDYPDLVKPGQSPRLIGPTERREVPEEIEFFADSSEQIDDSMNQNGLQPKVDQAFQEAIRQANGSRR